MTTYTVHFYAKADWAKLAIEAGSPAQALRRAGVIERDATPTLNFREYRSPSDGIERIDVRSSDGTTVAGWKSDDRRLRDAAGDLRDVLLKLQAANRTQGLSDAAFEAIEAEVEAALAKAGRKQP